MSRLLAAFLVFGLCASAQESSLIVYLHKSAQTPGSVLRAMEIETERLLRPLDTPLQWRDANSPQDDSGRLTVVKFSGSCSFADYNPGRPSQSKHSDPFASTHITDGRILPFVTIDCHKIRERIGPFVIGHKSADRDAALGRAMGRVLAHEMYHVLSGERKHAESGVAATCVSARDLLAERFDLDSWSLAQMRPARPELAILDDLEADSGGRD
jgi:hypothetical protein